MARGDDDLDLSLIDVELLVSSGVSRPAFAVLPRDDWRSTTVPMFRVDSSILLELGGVVDVEAGIVRGPREQEVDRSLPHPYDLGPIWVGANCWRAELHTADADVIGLVEHRWAEPHDGACEPGAELSSGSPWRWHVLRADATPVCGRAETPVLAAFSAESVLIEAGIRLPSRTRLRRDLTG